MMFSERLAKLGKGQSVNCFQISAEPNLFKVFVSNNGVKSKDLTVQNNNYNLSGSKAEYIYSEMAQVNSNFVVARVGNSFSVININGEDYGT